MIFKIFCLVLITFSLSAYSRSDLSADVTSLNYYPHKGRFEVAPYIDTPIINDTTNSNGGSSRTFYNQIFLNLIYGVAPGLRVSVSDTLLWDQTVDTIAATGAVSTTNAVGPSNPSLNIAYRYLKNEWNGLSGDLSVQADPSLGPKIAGGDAVSQVGNNLSGGWSANASTALFWRNGWNELGVTVQETRNYDSRTEGTTSPTSTTTSPFWSTSLTLSDRIHFNPNFYLQLSGVMTSHFETKVTSDTNVEKTVQTPTYWNPKLDFGFRAAPMTVFVLSVTYHDNTTTAVSAGGAEVSTRNRQMDAIFRLIHQI